MPHLSGIMSTGQLSLRSCQSAATSGDKNGALAGERETEGKQIDITRTK